MEGIDAVGISNHAIALAECSECVTRRFERLVGLTIGAPSDFGVGACHDGGDNIETFGPLLVLGILRRRAFAISGDQCGPFRAKRCDGLIAGFCALGIGRKQRIAVVSVGVSEHRLVVGDGASERRERVENGKPKYEQCCKAQSQDAR
jgi:hypothetical protein